MSCTWPINYSECITCEPLTSLPASGQAFFEEAAVEYLKNWTSPSLGLCEITVRPCKENCTEGQSTFWGGGPFPGGGAPWRPVIIGGDWFNLGCGNCGEKCSCQHVESITLPGPVDSITEIMIDGEVVPSGAYRVDNKKYLIRMDGGEWPRCQNMGLAAGEVGTWTITYMRGMSVPVGGQIAAGILACEFAKAACGDGTCQLPRRVQSITRQNVTVAAILDTFEDVDAGRTGIWLVDSWISSMTKPKRRSAVYSPDVARNNPRRTTWP